MAADCIERTTELSVAQDQENSNQHYDGHDHAHSYVRNLYYALLVGVAEELGQVYLGVGPGVEGCIGVLGDGKLRRGHDGGEAAGEKHARHGDDEGLDLEITHAEALDDAHHDAYGKDDEAHRHGAYAPVAHALSEQHAVERDERADRDVDAAGEHDAGHAAGHADEAGVVYENVEEGLEVSEALVGIHDAARRVHDYEQRNGDDQQNGVAVHGTPVLEGGGGLFVYSGRFHAVTASFSAAAALTARRFLKYAFTGGAWMATMTMTTTALNTGATSVETPRA